MIQSLEEEVKISLSINRVRLRKQSDTTIYSVQVGPDMIPEKDPGTVTIVSMAQMLYQVCSGVRPLVKTEEGDCIELQRATKAEVKFDAAHGFVRSRLTSQ